MRDWSCEAAENERFVFPEAKAGTRKSNNKIALLLAPVPLAAKERPEEIMISSSQVLVLYLFDNKVIGAQERE